MLSRTSDHSRCRVTSERRQTIRSLIPSCPSWQDILNKVREISSDRKQAGVSHPRRIRSGHSRDWRPPPSPRMVKTDHRQPRMGHMVLPGCLGKLHIDRRRDDSSSGWKFSHGGSVSFPDCHASMVGSLVGFIRHLWLEVEELVLCYGALGHPDQMVRLLDRILDSNPVITGNV